MLEALDAPGTTSAVTYTVYVESPGGKTLLYPVNSNNQGSTIYATELMV